MTEKMNRANFIRNSLLTMGAALLPGCGGGSASRSIDNPPPTGNGPGTVVGETRTVGNGNMRSFTTFDASGRPTAMGIVLTPGAFTGLPTDEREHNVQFPGGATAFNHVALFYRPNGHPPAGALDKSHFDITFFTISQQERDGICAASRSTPGGTRQNPPFVCSGEDLEKAIKIPPAEQIPIGFIQIPPEDSFYAEPRFGTRYFEVAALVPVLDGTAAFTRGFFYGFYDAKMISMEIAIRDTFILSKPGITDQIQLPRVVPRAGYYPTRYRVIYDATADEHIISFEGLVYLR